MGHCPRASISQASSPPLAIGRLAQHHGTSLPAVAHAAIAITQIRLRPVQPRVRMCPPEYQWSDGDQLVYLATQLCDAGDLDPVVATVRQTSA